MTTFSSESLQSIIDTEVNTRGTAFTIKSNKTGTDYTVKLKAKEFNGIVYIHMYVEQNYLEFKYVGSYNTKYKSFKLKNTGPATQGLQWIIKNIVSKQYNKVNEQVTLIHLGKCIKCGKTLTDATSIEYGLGPICRTF